MVRALFIIIMLLSALWLVPVMAETCAKGKTEDCQYLIKELDAYVLVNKAAGSPADRALSLQTQKWLNATGKELLASAQQTHQQ